MPTSTGFSIIYNNYKPYFIFRLLFNYLIIVFHYLHVLKLSKNHRKPSHEFFFKHSLVKSYLLINPFNSNSLLSPPGNQYLSPSSEVYTQTSDIPNLTQVSIFFNFFTKKLPFVLLLIVRSYNYVRWTADDLEHSVTYQRPLYEVWSDNTHFQSWFFFFFFWAATGKSFVSGREAYQIECRDKQRILTFLRPLQLFRSKFMSFHTFFFVKFRPGCYWKLIKHITK